MKSKVVLYYKSLVQEDKNFILRTGNTKEIEYYITSLTKAVINDFQYIKHDLVISIKINTSQANLELGNDEIDLNYVSITNYTPVENDEPTYEKPVYYFVAKKNWKSENTIELVLHMDTLNSFKYGVDYTISSKTLVHRMHKDRFAKIPNRTIQFSGTISANTEQDFYYSDLIVSKTAGTIVSCVFVGSHAGLSILSSSFAYNPDNDEMSIKVRIENILLDSNFTIKVIYSTPEFKRLIDMKSEEISVPKYKTSEFTLYDKVEQKTEWSLYYKNSEEQDITSPVDCFLIPNTPMQIRYMATAGKIDSNNLPNGKWAYICPKFPNQPLSFKQGDNVLTPEIGYLGEETYTKSVVVHNNNGTIEMYLLNANYVFVLAPSMDTEANYIKIGDGDVSVLNPPTSLSCHIENAQIPNTSSSTLFSLATSTNASDSLAMGSMTQTTMMDLATIDKTLSENIKIIHVPYSPTPYTIKTDRYEFAPCWTYNTTDKKLKLNDFSYRWTHKIEIDFPVQDLLTHFLDGYTINLNANRFIKDSKLYHSDYYAPKFVYDSFSKSFALELIDFYESLTITNARKYFAFTFVMSRNLQSKFLFKFDYVYNYSLEDYDNILAVARNNEEVLYSSQYLNYVRTGYNYDVKAKERQEAALLGGMATSGIGVLGSTILGVATGNPMALGTGMLSGLSFTGQIINYAKTSAQAEENIQRKLEETKRQAISVLNADDYDLMYEYAQNKPKLCYYQISRRMQNVLDDMFYYCGYSVEEQMTPEINSRYWFNFVQADLKILETSNLTSDIENDIIEKFKQGVTFMHMHIVSDTKTWDLEQEKENWENAIIPS